MKNNQPRPSIGKCNFVKNMECGVQKMQVKNFREDKIS
jgi:hypothetical protein